ncbi:MAG: hypothetical protein GXO59_02230 [Dictyoglomi bacterium]|nr:hypothetical protein [Dictyoglomota bacterium]
MNIARSVLRILIIIFTAWAILFGVLNTRFYCAITLDGIKSGYVFARTEEEFIEKTGLPINTIDSCPIMYDTEVKEYKIETKEDAVHVLTSPGSSTKTLLSIAGIDINPLDKIFWKNNKTLFVSKGWIQKKAKLIPLAPLIWKQVVYYDKNLPPGKVIRLQKAEGGLMEIVTYKYILDDKVIKTWTEKKIIKKPTPWIFKSGPHIYNGPYIKKFIALITAYSPEDPGVDWVTATGDRARKGVVAVDPRLIPLHSKLYIEGYGNGDAVDVGGWIKYYHIDVFFPTKAEALKWGKRYKWVYIIQYPGEKK